MNLVCSPLRASLNISNLDHLVRINLNDVGVNLPDHMLPILLKKFRDRREGRPSQVTPWYINKVTEHFIFIHFPLFYKK